tara:strand:- start:1031 stop:1756 length:726 start_codon:yes stop_codon:yes gene_type:complete
MRNYKVNSIKHTVYDVKKEVPPHINIVSNWRIGKLDDWVLTDDKCIIQIIRKGTMVTKSGEKSYVGTCTGTFIVSNNTYMDTDRRTNIYSFGGSSTPEQAVINRSKMTANEELFVLYISQGLSPEDSYVKAFPTNNKRYAKMKATNLIKTERIKTAVKEELKPILQDLDIDEKFILENIKIVAQTSEKDDTKLKALFKLSDIMDLEDKNQTKVQQVTGIAFQGLTNDMIEDAERPKEIDSE